MSARHMPRPVVVTVAALASALVVAWLLPGWAAAGPALPTASAALAAVDALPPTPNTAWGIDPATGQLVVTIADAAPVDGTARLLALADQFGTAMRIVHGARSFTEQGLADPLDPSASSGPLLGGDSISDGKIICSAGFNVVRRGQPYLLTAGHCTAGMPTWQGIGPSVVSAFPTSDYGLIRDDDADARGDVDLYNGTVQPITAVGTPFVGEQVCASGQTTEVTCGQVTAVDQTVDYGSGDVVRGLIKTSVHTDHGDSGGSLFDGSTGLGTVSGGDGAIDYFQPLAPALAAYGLELALP
ncbi:MAG TPA: S1 family peptidase [Pseudonocardiaceae bacterium]|nr:S1 family peptidase [Pseudonocardiaceae bacterium]